MRVRQKEAGEKGVSERKRGRNEGREIQGTEKKEGREKGGEREGERP